jgi:hypothetical protein
LQNSFVFSNLLALVTSGPAVLMVVGRDEFPLSKILMALLNLDSWVELTLEFMVRVRKIRANKTS